MSAHGVLTLDVNNARRKVTGMSKLRDWRKAKKMTQGRFAARVGTTGATVSRIEAGDQWPSAAIIAAIEKATKGGVKASDILLDYQTAQRAHQQAAE